MLVKRRPALLISAAVLALALAACSTSQNSSAGTLASTQNQGATLNSEQFERDRQSILAMEGDFSVTFNFTETVSFDPAYTLAAPQPSGAHEVVRVIEDRGDFISLQHILVVGHGDALFPIKHWRQDWQYQPERVLVFIGANAWEWQDVPEGERHGAWSQTVYQVDDAPRYGAVARWTYEFGMPSWTPSHTWRPLPRRDMTTRNDYHTINAVNRHVITPQGWVHEQDNDKLILTGNEPEILAREIGVNTYIRNSDFPVSIATDYLTATDDFWSDIRSEWDDIFTQNTRFGLTIQGETEALYMPLLELADAYSKGDVSLSEAREKGRKIVRDHVAAELAPLKTQIAETPIVQPKQSR